MDARVHLEMAIYTQGVCDIHTANTHGYLRGLFTYKFLFVTHYLTLHLTLQSITLARTKRL